MNNPVDQPKVSDLDAKAIKAALDAINPDTGWSVEAVLKESTTCEESYIRVAVTAYLAALPQPQATTVGVTTAREATDTELRMAAISAAGGSDNYMIGHIGALQSLIADERSALIVIPGAEKGEAVALLPEEIAERYERAIAAIKALPADAPNVDLLADVDELAADLSDIAKRPLYAAPTSERVQACDNEFAEYEGVTAKELAETVARYGKALHEIATSDLVTDYWVQEIARAALLHEGQV